MRHPRRQHLADARVRVDHVDGIALELLTKLAGGCKHLGTELSTRVQREAPIGQPERPCLILELAPVCREGHAMPSLDQTLGERQDVA